MNSEFHNADVKLRATARMRLPLPLRFQNQTGIRRDFK
jgi:hypothetical protein